MPEVLPTHVPAPRCVIGWDGTAYRAFAVDASGRASVRGEDQLFSFQGVLAVRGGGNPSGDNGYIGSPAVPAGQVWVVTAMTVGDITRALTMVGFYVQHDGVLYAFGAVYRAIAAREPVPWSGHVYLGAGDTIQGYMMGCQAGDTCWIECVGYRMTAET